MYRRASEPANAGGNIRSGQAGNIKLSCVTEWGAGEKLKLRTGMRSIFGRRFLLEPGKQWKNN